MIEEGTLAVVTLRSGYCYLGEYTLAPGIDYFWAHVTQSKHGHNQLLDPVVRVDLV